MFEYFFGKKKEKELKDNMVDKIPICPHCKNILIKIPKRKARCQNCNKYIFVRSKQNIFPSFFLSERDANAVDWMKRLGDYGLTVKDFVTTNDELSKRFNQKALSSDVIWGLFNKLLLIHRNDLQKLKSLHYSMALFLYDESRNPFPQLQESQRLELMYYKKSGTAKVKILTCKENSCEACRHFDGKVLEIDEAIKTMPIPCPNCTTKLKKDSKNGFCRCCYIAYFDLG